MTRGVGKENKVGAEMAKRHGREAMALRWNVEEVIKAGRYPTFALHTFWSQQDYPVMSVQWTKYQTRLCQREGLFGVRVFEFHEQWGLHVHTVQDHMVHPDVIEWARDGTIIGLVWQKPIWGGDVGRYLDKEITKQFDERDAIGRRWATFGKFNKTRVKDVVAFGPEVDCRREAWAMRQPGETRRDVEKVALGMYFDWLKGGSEERGGGGNEVDAEGRPFEDRVPSHGADVPVNDVPF